MGYDYNSEIQIYKGKELSKLRNHKTPIVIAFDLDETLGCFTDLEILWKEILKLNVKTNIKFNDLLDIYPEFLRYGILQILDFLYQKKKKGNCDKIYIYTNNQCSSEWCKMIAAYFDYKLNTDNPIFDQIICAFKINNEIIEISRTSNQKSHSDFINCTLLPKKTKICFIDNLMFPEMKHDRVYYIKPKSYYHHLSYENIIDRFTTSTLIDKNIKLNQETQIGSLKQRLRDLYMKDHIVYYDKGNSIKKTMETDILVSQKIMYHLNEFFYLLQKKNRTKKMRYPNGRFTRKKH
jgi:hypothetical protein